MLRPIEGFHQRLRQREARGFDENVMGPRLAVEEGREGRREIVGDGATETAVGELDDRLFRAGLVGAARDEVTVDADVAEFIDDEGEAAVRWRFPRDDARASSCQRRGNR